MSNSEALDSTTTVSFRDGLTRAEKDIARTSVRAMLENAKRTFAEPPTTGSAGPVSGLEEYEADDTISPYVLAMPPPFDFGWAWNHGQGPHRVITDHDTGRLILHARLGASGGNYTHVHAGFGIFLRTDRPARKQGAAGRRALIRWQTQTSGPGTHAMSEGGMEFTVLENGVFRGVEARSKLWRKRVSIDEEESYVGQMTQYRDPRVLEFSMEPGRDYTFNVGFWITCDRSSGTLGLGAAQCQGAMDGAVEGISIIDI